MATITDPYMFKPTLTADGRPWIQRCFMCGKGVDFTRTQPIERVRVGDLVRHKKCDPPPAK